MGLNMLLFLCKAALLDSRMKNKNLTMGRMREVYGIFEVIVLG